MLDSHKNREVLEEAITFLLTRLPRDCKKPVAIHSILVGARLIEYGYSADIVLAGLLHDIVEDSDVNSGEILSKFGKSVAEIVAACTKDEDILNKVERRKDVIARSAQNLKSAVVKAADILDNYKYYRDSKDKTGVDYCLANVRYMKQYAKDEYREEPIIVELFALG